MRQIPQVPEKCIPRQELEQALERCISPHELVRRTLQDLEKCIPQQELGQHTPQAITRRSLPLALERCTPPQELTRHTQQDLQKCVPKQEFLRHTLQEQMYSSTGAGAAKTEGSGEMYSMTGACAVYPAGACKMCYTTGAGAAPSRALASNLSAVSVGCVLRRLASTSLRSSHTPSMPLAQDKLDTIKTGSRQARHHSLKEDTQPFDLSLRHHNCTVDASLTTN